MLTKRIKKEYLLIILISIIFSAAGWYYYGNPADTIYGDSGYHWNGINLINKNISNIIFSQKIGIVESLNTITLGILSYMPMNTFIIIYAFQILLYSLTSVIIYKFSLDFVGKKGAIFVLLFYFINYKHLMHIYILKPGVWVNFLLALSVLLAYYAYKNPRNLKNWIVFGFSSGFLFLQDMRYIPHIGILLLSITTQLKPYKEIFIKIPAYMIIVILVITPWLIRQASIFQRFIFISDINTITIHKAFNTDYYKSLGENFNKYDKLSNEEFENKFYELCDSLNLSPAELIYSKEKADYDKARNDTVNPQHEKLISEDKLTRAEVEKLVIDGESKSKFRQYFEYGLSMWFPLNWDYRYEPMAVEKEILEPASKINLLIIFLTSGIFIPLLLIASYYNLKNGNFFGIALLILFALHTAIHVLTYVQARYMLPLLPFKTAVAYQGILQIVEIYRKIKISYNDRISVRNDVI